MCGRYKSTTSVSFEICWIHGTAASTLKFVGYNANYGFRDDAENSARSSLCILMISII